MAIIENNYPVTGSVGSYQNIFPSQKPIFANFTRRDATLSTLSSGTDGFLRIVINETFDNIQVGQLVVFRSDGYELQRAFVNNVIDTSTIEVDVLFDSTNATNGFINYKINYYLEVRFVLPDQSSDDQNALVLLDDFLQVPSNLDGSIEVNLNTPAELLNPEIDLQEGLKPSLFSEFKIQYRESWLDNRSESWISPSLDVPILLVHASQNFTTGFTDTTITKKYYKGYPTFYTIVYSNINDAGNNNFKVDLTQRALNKSIIDSSNYLEISNLNGVYLLSIPSSAIDDDTCFLEFTSQLITDNSQYESTQYNDAEYA